MSTNAAQSVSSKGEIDPLRMPIGDQRKYRRFDVELDGYAALVPFTNPDDLAWELFRSDADRIRIMNLSPSGLYFVSTVEFSTEDVVWISLMFEGQLTTVRASVIHCQSTETEEDAKSEDVEEFGTGVQFVKSAFAEKAISEILSYLNSIGGG